MSGICNYCGSSADAACGDCRAVAYCSAVCQARDWSAGHQFVCTKVQRGRVSLGKGSKKRNEVLKARQASLREKEKQERIARMRRERENENENDDSMYFQVFQHTYTASLLRTRAALRHHRVAVCVNERPVMVTKTR